MVKNMASAEFEKVLIKIIKLAYVDIITIKANLIYFLLMCS